MSKKNKKRNDIILAALILIIAAAGIFFMNIFKTDGAFAVVKVDGVETARYSLSENTEIVITTGENNEFKNTLVIEDNKAFIKNANCPDKICEEHKAISFKGETIVCLPHKVVIEIVADENVDGLDAAV